MRPFHLTSGLAVIGVLLLLCVAMPHGCRADSILSRMLRHVVPAKLRAYIEDDVDIDPLLESAATTTTTTDNDDDEFAHSANSVDALLLQQAEESVLDAIDFYDDDDDEPPADEPASTAGTQTLPVKTVQPPMKAQSSVVWNVADGNVDVGDGGFGGVVGGSGDTSGWNPFTWFAPKLRSIPYNPDTDLQTVCVRNHQKFIARNNQLCFGLIGPILRCNPKCSKN